MYVCKHEYVLLCMYMHAFLFFPVPCVLAYLRRLRGSRTTVYNNLIRRYTENGARLFSEVHDDRVRGNRHKLEPKEFQLGIRKFFLTVSVIKYCNRLPMEAMGVSVLGGIQDLTGHGLEQPDLIKQEGGLDGLWRSLIT